MKATAVFFKSVLFLGLIIVTTQDITGRKGCDCSICKGVDNKINSVVGKKISESDGGKSTCNICEHKKRMLQEERERQEKLQKCPFEILASSSIKGKTSEEVFDEFRELVIPSQNGFFDMMRGVVKTMHVSTEQELKWAREKEAKELAKKKEEEARKAKEPKPNQDELVGINSPVNPKVTVVLKQTPCGQIVPQVDRTETELGTLMRRLPKDTSDDYSLINDDEILQRLELLPGFNMADGNTGEDLLNMDLNENLLHSDLLQQLVGYNQWITDHPQEETTESSTFTPEFYEHREEKDVTESVTEYPQEKTTKSSTLSSEIYEYREEEKVMKSRTEPPQEETTESSTLPTEIFEYREEENIIEADTESPYVKFMTDEELKAQSSGKIREDDINFILPTSSDSSTQRMENFPSEIETTTEFEF